MTRKGGKVVTIPLAPRTARAIDLAVGERTEGAIFLARMAVGWTGTSPAGILRRISRRAGINKLVGPHTLRHEAPRGRAGAKARPGKARPG